MPSGGALFGNTATRSLSKNLVEFKAGRMTMKGNMVHPEKAKGLVYVYQSEDSLMHFCWKDRQTGAHKDDLIIFPDDCEFKKVPQCTTGRVYVLKFKSTNRKLFFWLQEPKTDKDEENCRKVNDVLNNPPTPGSQRSETSGRDGDIQNLLSNMNQQQLAQLFGNQINQISGLSNLLGTMGRPSSGSSGTSRGTSTAERSSTASSNKSTSTTTASTVPATPTPAKTSSSSTNSSAATLSTPVSSHPDSTIQLRDLQTLLSGLENSGVPGASAGGSAGQRSVDLSPAITPEALQAILNNPALVQELQQHLPTLGPDGNLKDQLKSTLASPQFQQAVSMFCAALQSGQLGPVVQQFDVGTEAVSATNQGNMEDFVRALQNASISQQTTTTSSHERPEQETTPTQPEKRHKADDKVDSDGDVNME